MRRDVRSAAAPRLTPPGRGAAPPTGIPAKPKSYRRDPDPQPGELILTIEGNPVSKERPRFDRRSGRAFTPQKTRDEEERIAWLVRAAFPSLRCDRHSLFDLELGFFCKGNRQRDRDNMTKLIQDALEGVVWFNDSQVRGGSDDVVYDSSRPRTEITIRRRSS